MIKTQPSKILIFHYNKSELFSCQLWPPSFPRIYCPTSCRPGKPLILHSRGVGVSTMYLVSVSSLWCTCIYLHSTMYPVSVSLKNSHINVAVLIGPSRSCPPCPSVPPCRPLGLLVRVEVPGLKSVGVFQNQHNYIRPLIPGLIFNSLQKFYR